MMQGVLVLLATSVCCMVGTWASPGPVVYNSLTSALEAAAHEGNPKCDDTVIAPNISLSEFDCSCDSSSKSRTAGCVAAMQSFCNDETFPDANIKKLGVSREEHPDSIDISCVRAEYADAVKIDVLEGYHPACDDVSLSQDRACLSAIHRFCLHEFGQNSPSGLNYSYAGISQGVEPFTGALYVNCFYTPTRSHVPLNDLTALDSGCTPLMGPGSDSDSSACFAAVSRWCVNAGHDGGISQEVNGSGVTVTCYDAEFSGNVFISPEGSCTI